MHGTGQHRREQAGSAAHVTTMTGAPGVAGARRHITQSLIFDEHRDHDLASRAEIRDRCGSPGTRGYERFGRGWACIEDGDIVARCHEPMRHPLPHATQPDEPYAHVACEGGLTRISAARRPT
jgi:hypothetical protein